MGQTLSNSTDNSSFTNDPSDYTQHTPKIHDKQTNNQSSDESVKEAEYRPTHAALVRDRLIGYLYNSLDPAKVGFIDRDTVLRFLRNDRFLNSKPLVSKTKAVSDELDHSEDDRCSKHELKKAMKHFTLCDVAHLTVDLCRILPLKRPVTPLKLECQKVEASKEPLEKEEKEAVEQLDDQSIEQTKKQLTAIEISDSEKSNRHFLTICLFSALDVDMNGKCSVEDLNQSLSDEFFQQGPFQDWADKIKQAVADHASSSHDGDDLSSLSPQSKANVGLNQQEFQAVLDSIDLDILGQIFMHLVLQRSHAVLTGSGAMCTKRSQPSQHHKDMLDSILRADVPVHDKSKQSRLVHREHQQSDIKLEITLLGQSLIQHDIRNYEFGRQSIDEIKNLIDGECVFSELETAVLTDPSFQPRRKTIFFHSAPVEVIDVIKEIGINLIALANNHAGDLGPEPVGALQKAVESRGIVSAGAGENLDAASSPAYLKTRSGCLIGLVAHASKVPPGSEATNDRPGVFSVSMKDSESCTLNEEDARRALCSVAAARRNAAVVIAYQHNHYWTGDGAVNHPHWMASWKQSWARSLIDAGATIYVSHGQPRLLGIEIYNGCPLFYGLSSLIFQTKTELGFYGPEVWLGCIVSLVWSDRTSRGDDQTCDYIHERSDPARAKADETACAPASSVAIKLTPLTLNERGVPSEPPEMHFATRGLPRRADHEQSIRILNYVQELSRPFDTVIHIEHAEDGPIGWVTHSSNATK